MQFRALVVTGGIVVLMGVAAPAFSQPDPTDRMANQADRISRGIRDGSLTAGEAARLEREQAGIAREDQRFLKDGTLSDAEKAKLNRDQNRASRDIYGQRHDAQVNPKPGNLIDQRRANQEARIGAGVRDGSLTPGEAARLQRQQARIGRQERHAQADGMFTSAERHRIARHEDLASHHIYRERHDGQHR